MILFLASLPCQHIGLNPVLMGIEQTAPGMGHDPIAVLSSFQNCEATTSSFLRQMKDRVCMSSRSLTIRGCHRDDKEGSRS